MKRILILATAAILAVGAIGTASANGDDSDRKSVKATLGGFAEVPSISTAGKGKLRITIDSTNTTISYELTYSDLSGAATGAHLHLGQAGTSGGIIADLCGGSKPACPATAAGTVSGTIVAANVLGPVAQGIAGPADWAEVLRAIRAGAVYSNVHSALYGGGEIRGQLRGGSGWH
ncbi:MAG: hypothetical protein HW391_900 [Chloroflexi bacterium]|nr:hypothetical protein [Chloroflexota bacterium]